MRVVRLPFAALLCFFTGFLITAPAQTLTITNGVSTYTNLVGSVVTMTGHSELHISANANVLDNSIVHLNSPDAWLFLPNVRPSVTASSVLSRVRVNGANATLNGNVRVVQYAMGSVVIPHAPAFQPLEVFSRDHFRGESRHLGLYTVYNETSLGAFNNAISSFRLRRGYMATFAEQSNGAGVSKVYVAQDGDLEVSLMADGLDDSVSFVRVVPWRWTSKKGWAGGVETLVNPQWNYDWDNVVTSTLDVEYVPMRHNANWNAYGNINNKQNSTHALGFNEPDRPDQANMTVAQALAQWPNLLASGLRLGSPAPSDAASGLTWLYDFIAQADALKYRVDYVAVHFYKCNWTASQYYNWLLGIHEQTGRPIWITEFNNGANWCAGDPPSYAANATRIAEFIEMLDNAPFVERYAIYNWVGATRELVTGGTLNPAGLVYRDNVSPLAYAQELPEGRGGIAQYSFDGSTRDGSGFGNNAMLFGVPEYGPGHTGEAILFDGNDDYVRLPANLGDSVDFTFAAWVHWEGDANWHRIFDLGSGTSQHLFLTPRAGDGAQGMRFTIRNGGTAQSIEAAPLASNQWVHVAVTLEGNTGRLYVNGAQVGINNSMTLNPVNAGANWNFLGRSQFPSDPLFHGRMDDVLIVDHALSEEQVAALLNNQPPQFATDVITRENAMQGEPYAGTIAVEAMDPDGVTVTFSKASGPAWLTISVAGALTGTPGAGDGGTNNFVVRATDAAGLSSFATLTIVVDDRAELVARYAFDGSVAATAGTADGILTGAAAYVAGRNGLALDLNGSSNFVTLPPGVADSEDITIACWVNWDGGAAWQRIFDFGNNEAQNMFLTPGSGSGTLRFAIKNGGPEQIIQTTALPVGQWTHLAVTLSGNTGRLYVNGENVATAFSMTLNPSAFNPINNYIGKSQYPDPYFNGRIDEFFIYDHALSAEQIGALMTNQPPVFNTDPVIAPVAVPSRLYSYSVEGMASDADAGDALVYSKSAGPAWLRVNPDGSLFGTPGAADTGLNVFRIRATDSSEVGVDATVRVLVSSGTDLLAQYEFESDGLDSVGTRHGSVVGGPLYAAGKNGRAIDLDGVNDYVTIPSAMLNLADITIAAWVNWDGGDIWQRIFDFGNTTTRYMFLTPRSSGNTLRFAITASGNGNEQRLETAQLPVGEWAHLTVTLEGNTGTLYVNGTAAASGSITLDPLNLAIATSYIGRSQFPNDPLFNGRVDGVRIYNRALSPFEIMNLAHPDMDSDADGFSDSAETDADADGDGLPNYLDDDSDNDELPDRMESFADSDGNGLPDIWSADSDSDSMPDGWEWMNGLNPSDPSDAAEDSDGDGLTNAAEFIAGTSPQDKSDSFQLAVEITTPLALRIPGKAGRIYTLLRSDSVAAPPEDWVQVDTAGPLESNEAVILSDPAPPGEVVFYRATVGNP